MQDQTENGGRSIVITRLIIGLIAILIAFAGFYLFKPADNADTRQNSRHEGDGIINIPKNDKDLALIESTISGFIMAAASGDAKLAQSYFSHQGPDYEDIMELFTAQENSHAYSFRKIFESIDTQQPLNITSIKEGKNGLNVTWRVTFKDNFTIEEGRVRQEFHPGDTFDLDGTVLKEGDHWLFYGI